MLECTLFIKYVLYFDYSRANCNCSCFRSDVSISLYTKKTKVEHLCNTYHHSTQVGGSGLQFQPVIICHKSSQNCVFLSTYSKTFKHRMKFLAGKKSIPESIHASLSNKNKDSK